MTAAFFHQKISIYGEDSAKEAYRPEIQRSGKPDSSRASGRCQHMLTSCHYDMASQLASMPCRARHKLLVQYGIIPNLQMNPRKSADSHFITYIVVLIEPIPSSGQCMCTNIRFHYSPMQLLL